ncbi:unnamed protein product [Lampetra fluviatilis]
MLTRLLLLLQQQQQQQSTGSLTKLDMRHRHSADHNSSLDPSVHLSARRVGGMEIARRRGFRRRQAPRLIFQGQLSAKRAPVPGSRDIAAPVAQWSQWFFTRF